MAKQRVGPRIPLDYDGLQVNFCKNPRCENFGVPPSVERQPRGPGASSKPGRDNYSLDSKNGRPVIICLLCNQTWVLKSNLGVAEEVKRMQDALAAKPTLRCCPNPGCKNKTGVDEDPCIEYQYYGTTEIGSVRFKCKTCKKTFSIPLSPKGVPHSRQKVHGYKNIEIFNELVNNVVLNRICKMRDIPYKLLIDKIEFIHGQCQSFVAQRERLLQEQTKKYIYLSVDRQVYNVNWSKAKDKRVTALLAVGSAEKYSGYVFGMHLNFDAKLNATELNKECGSIRDMDLPAPFRRFARLWLTPVYEPDEIDLETDPILDEAISLMATKVVDPDAYDAPSDERKLPDKGVQIHYDYTLYAHFQYLKRMLPKTKQFVFYVDDESGIDGALFSTFSDEVLRKECEAFVVKINKEMDVNEKRREKYAGDVRLAEFIESNPDLRSVHKKVVKQKYLELLVASQMVDGILVDKTLEYPFPDMSEPEKYVRWITDLERKVGGKTQSVEDIAALYRRATLHPIDRFFMQIRSGVKALGRSMYTASNTGGRWYPNAPYNPERVTWLLEIYRTAYNYIFVGKDKKTPAMRFGLAKAPLDFKDIIYFRPEQ